MQLDVFDDQREADEELSNHGPPGIDLSSHVDVFYAIFGQVRIEYGRIYQILDSFSFFLFFFFSTLDRRHPPRDTISEHPSTSVAARSERRRQRFGVGHGGNIGPQSDSVGESRRRYQTVAFA